jgi:hypothetical protein
MERKIGTSTRATTEMTSLNQYVGATLDFDQIGVSGSLGDKIQVGRIVLNGSGGNITMSNIDGVNVLFIGDDGK